MEPKEQKKSHIIIDFDSTFMQVEALEELADIVLKDSADRERIVEEIKAITSLGVDGKITFNQSLKSRLGLLKVHRNHLEKLVRRLKRKVSTSFSRNKAFFKKFRGQIYIVSNGFKDFIDPIVKSYDISPDFVLANTFLFDHDGWVTGFDEDNYLAHSKGKSRTLKALDLEGEILVIGDAYTDFEMVEAGIAHKFYAFTENVLRENILEMADHVTPSFDEFLYVNQMPRALSYPKNRIKVALVGNFHEDAVKAFTQEGYEVEVWPKDLKTGEMADRLKQVTVLGVDKQTTIAPKLLTSSKRLMAIGVFGTSTGQVDIDACTTKGVTVFNAPYINTRSQVELVIGQMIMLLRKIPTYSRKSWEGLPVETPYAGFEIKGKKLGIIGYGHAGQQLSVMAEALGMEVLYYDLIEKPPLGNAIRCNTLKTLLRKADVVSIHVDTRSGNHGFFGATAFRSMRKQSVLINLSNEMAIDLSALTNNLESGKLLGAALDIALDHPDPDTTALLNKIRTFDNVILTPNIAGTTLEASEAIATHVPQKIFDYINTGTTAESVNFPRLKLPVLKNAHRLIHIHRNRPGMLASIDNVLAKHRINILGQYLMTNEQIGYVIIDINRKYSEEVLKELKGIKHTIKFRVLY